LLSLNRLRVQQYDSNKTAISENPHTRAKVLTPIYISIINHSYALGVKTHLCFY